MDSGRVIHKIKGSCEVKGAQLAQRLSPQEEVIGSSVLQWSGVGKSWIREGQRENWRKEIYRNRCGLLAKRNYLSKRTRSKEREPKPKEAAELHSPGTWLRAWALRARGSWQCHPRKELEIQVNGKLLLMKRSWSSQTQRNGIQQSVIRRAFKSICQSG